MPPMTPAMMLQRAVDGEEEWVERSDVQRVPALVCLGLSEVRPLADGRISASWDGGSMLRGNLEDRGVNKTKFHKAREIGLTPDLAQGARRPTA